MSTNMEWRHLLMNNADTIIRNNQNIAIGNCSNIVTINQTNSILDEINPFNLINNLRNNYLKTYKYNSERYTPVFNLN